MKTLWQFDFFLTQDRMGLQIFPPISANPQKNADYHLAIVHVLKNNMAQNRKERIGRSQTLEYLENG